jgi:glycosyltransferase involved in cell wall biosynthesis
MPVFNTGAYLAEAIESILNQSFSDFEFIIVDDASTDNSTAILDSFADSRIIKLKNKSRTGSYPCRNQGLAVAKGDYICVMDSDDIAHADRFKKQLEFMEANPGFIAAGTAVEYFNSAGYAHVRQFDAEHETLKVNLLMNSVYNHPSLIFRREAYFRYGIKYDERYFYAADYDLMVQLGRTGAIANMKEVLLKYRSHSGQISSAKSREQSYFVECIRLKQLEFFKIRPTAEETALHIRLMESLPIYAGDLMRAKNWLYKLYMENKRWKAYDDQVLHDFLNRILIHTIKTSF